MSVYETYAYLYGFPHLRGQVVKLEYLPTGRCKRWRNAGVVGTLNGRLEDNALALLDKNNWHTYRFVKAS